MTKNRKNYLDYLRVFAAFAVIIIHVSSQNLHLTEVGSINWNIFKAYLMASNWAVPVFCMISGSLFLSKDIDIKTIVTKYIFRIALAFVGWSLFYALVFELKNGWDSVAASFVRGYSHLWFLYMIAGLYLVTPILRHVAKDVKLLRYFIVLGFITSILIPEVLEIIGVVSSKSGGYLSGAYSSIDAKVVSGYAVYYMLGYYLDMIEIKRKQIVKLFMAGIALYIVPVVILILYASHFKMELAFLTGNFAVGDFFRSVTIFLLAKYYVHENNKETRVGRILRFVGYHTFTLYLVHQFVITMLNRLLGLNTFTFATVLSVPAIGVISFLISIAIAVVLDNIWNKVIALIIKKQYC
ncbi:acyltransferase [Butyrivibrio sp. FCS006]|uniref:acyltransferase n=1 Tax=Butyrivibrio sp. FCS006 TaxID=1280684 RepID=UPI000419BDAE|nr:acyltransferase family protein [Butyrivibrio sp. FCS006]